jgi:hypothetical protein
LSSTSSASRRPSHRLARHQRLLVHLRGQVLVLAPERLDRQIDELAHVLVLAAHGLEQRLERGPADRHERGLGVLFHAHHRLVRIEHVQRLDQVIDRRGIRDRHELLRRELVEQEVLRLVLAQRDLHQGRRRALVLHLAEHLDEALAHAVVDAARTLNALERGADLVDRLAAPVGRDVEHGHRGRRGHGVVLAHLGLPLEALEQRGQRARVAHLGHQLQHLQTVLRVLRMLEIGLDQVLVRDVVELLQARMLAIALRVGEPLREDAEQPCDGVLAPHRIVQLLGLTLRVVVVCMAPRERERC